MRNINVKLLTFAKWISYFREVNFYFREVNSYFREVNFLLSRSDKGEI